jgi:hypothetical protein
MTLMGVLTMVPNCPQCSAPMVERNGKRGGFYGCTRFSQGCRGTRELMSYTADDNFVPVGSVEQQSIWDFLANGIQNAIVEARAGSGKAQPLTAKILTPSGWKLMGELSVGDEIVDPDGGIGFVEEIFPQGKKQVFNVMFSDGSTQCCEDHLWLTQTVNERRNLQQTSSVKSLKEIRSTLMVRNGARKNHYIPLTQTVAFAKQELTIHPYLLGILLGNGHFSNNAVLMSSNDKQIVDRVRELIPASCRLVQNTEYDYAIRGTEWHVNEMVDLIASLGLTDKKSAEKFVPEKYLHGSVEDRLDLLHGLMDTDGYTGGYVVEYSTVSPFLAAAVQELVWSFGGKCNITLKTEPKYEYKGEIRTGQLAYRVWVNLPATIPPFTLERKANAHIPKSKYQPYRSITDIIPVGEVECQCIRVSTKRNLYITDDYIVTHNTYTITNGVYKLRHLKIAVFSFNNHIIKEMNQQLIKKGISWVRGLTYNSFGNRALKTAFPNAELMPEKLDQIVIELVPDSGAEAGIIRGGVEKLARLCKCYMEDGKDQEVLTELIDRFGVDLGSEGTQAEIEKRTVRVMELVPQVLSLCLKRTGVYDFDDQVWFPVTLGLPVEKFDMVLIDEAQDTNAMQQKMAELACPE